MNNLVLLRTAAIELTNVDSKDVVKVAGILRRIKNWWQAFSDPAYKKQIEELRNQSSQVNELLSSLESEIQSLQSAIADTDVTTYESSLHNVRTLSAQLAAALKDYRGTTQKAETSAPEQTVEIPTAEDTPATEGPSRFTSYTLKQLKDPAIREQLEKQLPSEYDVPLNQTINKPVTSFQWFWSLGAEDFYLSEDFVRYFQKALAEVLALRKIRITGDPNQDLAIYNFIVQLPEVDAQIREKLPIAAIDGTLIRVDFQKPSKQVSHRNANEMLTVIQTAPFDIVLPATEYFEGPKKLSVNAVVLFNDMRSAYVRGQHMSAAGVKNLRIVNHDFPMSVGARFRIDILHQLQKQAQQNVHQWARKILTEAFEQEMGRAPTPNELQAAQSVALLETNYGRGWGKGKIWWARHTRLGVEPDGRAAGSNNWGAIQTRTSKPPDCPGEAFRYVDSHPTSSGEQRPYVVCFKAYPTPVAGARDLIATLYKGKGGSAVLNAANAGSVIGFSSAMYDRHYYGGFGKNPAERVAGHASVVNKVMKNITSGLGEKPAFDLRDKPKKQEWIADVAAYRGQKQMQRQVPATVTNTPTGDFMQEYQSLLNQLAASRDYGAVETLVRRAMERVVLPTTKMLMVVQTGPSLPVRMRYARILASAMREELGAETSIHHKGNKIEIECDVVGTEKAVQGAVNALAEGVSNAFATATNGKLVKTQHYMNLQSRYPLLDSQTSETNFRKFAFEMMVHNG